MSIAGGDGLEDGAWVKSWRHGHGESPCLIGKSSKHIYFYGAFSMAMLNNHRDP
jgi:hypothetical protein